MEERAKTKDDNMSSHDKKKIGAVKRRACYLLERERERETNRSQLNHSAVSYYEMILT